jgi:hypothetical protein
MSGYEDGSEDGYEDGYEDGSEYGKFQNEIDAHKRSGKSGGGSRDPSDIAYYFRNKVNAIVEILEGKDILKKEQKEEILNKIDNTPDVQFKNPSAYILGYIGNGGGRGVTQESIQRAQTCIESLRQKNERVTIEDIIRYSFFWKEVILRPQNQV